MTPELAKALEFFDNNIGGGDDVVPEGFFSARQISDAKGLADDQHTKLCLDRMVDRGVTERRVFKVGRHRTAYYKVKK